MNIFRVTIPLSLHKIMKIHSKWIKDPNASMILVRYIIIAEKKNIFYEIFGRFLSSHSVSFTKVMPNKFSNLLEFVFHLSRSSKIVWVIFFITQNFQTLTIYTFTIYKYSLPVQKISKRHIQELTPTPSNNIGVATK